MEIRPVHHDRPSSGREETEKTKKNGEQKAIPAIDNVEITNEVRMKLAVLADRALYATSKTHHQSRSKAKRKSFQHRDDKTAKLKQVRDRIKSGFYNRNDVKQEIADRLATKFKKNSGKEK